MRLLMRHLTKVRLISAAVLSASIAIVACTDNPLDVRNQANPDISKVYGSPKDVETIVSKLFQQLWNAQQANTGIGVQTMVMSFESHSALANFGLGARAGIPRGIISNALGNANQTENFTDFDGLQRNARSASNAIAAIYKFNAAGNTIGSVARDIRAKAFAYFELGYALGNVALIYDSAAIILPSTPSDEIPPLSGAKDVMAAALQAMDSALAYASSPDIANGASGFPIPGGWLGGLSTPDMSAANFSRLVRSYKARFRANVARTPAERNAVNWDAVIADTQNGITADFIVNADATLGWSLGWRSQLGVDATWSQMTPMILGMADTTLAYDAWLQTPLDKRSPFLLRTPDKRFPSGETRAIQTAIQGSSRAGTPAGSILYYINRPAGDDKIGEPWGNWFYDNWRFWGPRAAGGNGPVVAFAVAENDLLQAEGQYRKGNVAATTALIDKTRVRAGLPALAGVVTTLTGTVPGGNACVPRVPQAPSFTTTACGSLFEALKWEKRVETAFTGYAQWWLDSRGWGDLVEGTALEWAVPWQELFARLGPTYTNTLRAAKGNYGL
jgi:hypothetical protein